MGKKLAVFPYCTCALLLAHCSLSEESGRVGKIDPLLVFAAASATEALPRALTVFEERSGLEVTPSFASSSALAQQIEAGADAALFLSANREWVDYLEEHGLVRRRVDLLGNGLVLVVPRVAEVVIEKPEDLASEAIQSIAIADPSGAPAGIYAVQALEALGLKDAIWPKLLPAADVRQALLYVEYGEADAGIVYATDAQGSDRVTVVAKLDDVLDEPVVYTLAALTGFEADGRVARLFDYLVSAEAGRIFEDVGFSLLTAEESAKGL